MASNKVLTQETLGHAVSGAAGSVFSMLILYPLDTVRSLMQVDEKRDSKNSLKVIAELIQDEGVHSLYRGLIPVLTSLCTSNFVYFYTFHGLRQYASSKDHQYNAIRDLALATIAGMVNVMVTTPLWVVNTRIKFQGAKLKSTKYAGKRRMYYNGVIDGLIKVGRSEGFKGLWSGMVPSLILTLNPGIQFMVYEALKRYFKMYLNQQDLSGTMYFIIGAIAKAAATVPTYPLQILQSRLRFAVRTKDTQKKTEIFAMMLDIIKMQGLSGLYKGIEAKFLQTILTSALMFLFYEKIMAFVFHIMQIPIKPFYS